MGRFDAGVAAARRAVVLDPLARATHDLLGQALYFARRYEESLAAFADTISLDPDYWASHQCLAVVYDKLGRHADAEAELAKLKALGDGADPGLTYLKTDPLMDPLRQEPRFQAIQRELKFPD
jgi:tetratricopeptide (TPR) repeat protein